MKLFRRSSADAEAGDPRPPNRIDVAVQATREHSDGVTSLDLGCAHRVDAIRLPGPSAPSGQPVRVEASNFGRDWHTIAEGRVVEGSHLEFSLGRTVWSRHLRIVGTGPDDPPTQVFTAPAAARRARPSKLVLAHRSDGLGERLNEMVAARTLATLLGADFAFSWPDDLADDDRHAIRVVDEMFSPEFVENCHVDPRHLKVKRFKSSIGARTELDRLLLGAQALRCPYSGVAGLDPDDFGALDAPRGHEFNSMGFADDLRVAIRAAYDVPLPPSAVALHLRGGDLVVGQWRHVGQYTHKAISIPVARALIDRLEEQGRTVVMFGQEIDVLAELSSTTGAVIFVDIAPEAFDDRVAQTLFELVCLSRFDVVVGGTSGFVRQAAAIGGSLLRSPDDLVTNSQQLDACLTDDKLTRGAYHPRQVALAWWSAFLAGRQSLDVDSALALLRRAADADPDTSLYDLVSAALLYDCGRVGEGNRVIANRLTSDAASSPEMPLLDLITTRRPARSTIGQAVGSLRAASNESAMARLVMASLTAVELDIAGAVASIRRDERELRSGGLGQFKGDLVELVLGLTPRRPTGEVDHAENQAWVSAIQQWRDDLTDAERDLPRSRV